MNFVKNCPWTKLLVSFPIKNLTCSLWFGITNRVCALYCISVKWFAFVGKFWWNVIIYAFCRILVKCRDLRIFPGKKIRIPGTKNYYGGLAAAPDYSREISQRLSTQHSVYLIYSNVIHRSFLSSNWSIKSTVLHSSLEICVNRDILPKCDKARKLWHFTKICQQKQIIAFYQKWQRV